MIGPKPRALADFPKTGHQLMAAPHPTLGQCLKAALWILCLVTFFFVVIRDSGGGEKLLEGAGAQLTVEPGRERKALGAQAAMNPAWTEVQKLASQLSLGRAGWYIGLRLWSQQIHLCAPAPLSTLL